MDLTATIANSLWSATNLPSYFRFCRALGRPETAQRRRLQLYLEQNLGTAFGRKHGFGSIRSYREFANRVPLMDYDDLEPWVERVRRGEANVLTHEPVTRLLPTSGSTGARKLIPFTAGLQTEFNAAIGPWLMDLSRQSPGITAGPAYWSITPAMATAETQGSAVPIGFDSDAAYLGGTRQRLAASIMAVPAAVGCLKETEIFRYVTLLCLLRRRDLRVISVWHPSFLSLLLESLPANWQKLLEDIKRGECRHTDALPSIVRDALNQRSFAQRARELESADPQRPETLWPHLKLISCWSDGAARLAATRLKTLFPNSTIQPKGLLATEGVVTIPFAGLHPAAVCSHFLEFIDDAGAVRLVHQLHAGESYEVVVTTAGGLWRYRLGDRVQVTGFIAQTPSLSFIGRSGNVSDLFGEKLAEPFVTETIQEALAPLTETPRFVLLAPDKDAAGCRYTLYLEGTSPNRLAEAIDHALRRNPNYACCRDLGQLLPVRVFSITRHGYETFVDQQSASGARHGDVKPAALSRKDGWSNMFAGSYL